MNNVTDITILIAVIAHFDLANNYGPPAGAAERNFGKLLKTIFAGHRDELDDISTQDLVISTLKKIGCQPSINQEGNVTFKYQGDDFYIAAEEDSRFIMIWNPWWGSDNEAFPYLKEFINLVNVNSLVTTVYMADEDEKTVGIHSRCHTYFSPNEGELEEHLKLLLDSFFDTHNAIKENMNQLGSAAAEAEEKKDRVFACPGESEGIRGVQGKYHTARIAKGIKIS